MNTASPFVYKGAVVRYNTGASDEMSLFRNDSV